MLETPCGGCPRILRILRHAEDRPGFSAWIGRARAVPVGRFHRYRRALLNSRAPKFVGVSRLRLWPRDRLKPNLPRFEMGHAESRTILLRCSNMNASGEIDLSVAAS